MAVSRSWMGGMAIKSPLMVSASPSKPPPPPRRNAVGTGGTSGIPGSTANAKYSLLGASRPLFSRFSCSSACVSNRSKAFSSREKS